MINFISRLLDNKDPIIIIPFDGYSNEQKIFAQARVLEDEGIDEYLETSYAKHLVHSFKRFETDEKPNVDVKVNWQNGSKTYVTDKEGYIYVDFEHGLDLNHDSTLWIPLTYCLQEEGRTVYSITHPVMKPSPKSEYGVISDLDETILDTGLDSFLKWKVVVNTFLKASHERTAVEGAQKLCNLLHRGSSGHNENPFFYLSNSPWNLYNYLQAFLHKNHFPKGTLLLRDIGLENKKKPSFMEENKFVKIKHIVETYPKLSFILVGDAQDIDPEIYLEIATRFPDRVRCVYIRTVENKKKLKKIKALIERTVHVRIVLAESTDEIIDHARTNGYIM